MPDNTSVVKRFVQLLNHASVRKKCSGNEQSKKRRTTVVSVIINGQRLESFVGGSWNFEKLSL